MDGPSGTELTILKAFWRSGALSAREVHDQVGPELGWAVSTTRTMLERMRAKGLLSRRSSHGLAVYAPAQAKTEVIGGFLRRVVRDLLEIEGKLPVAAFSGSQIISREELEDIERMVNGSEEDQP